MMELLEEVCLTSAEIVRCLNKQLVDALHVNVSGFAGDGTIFVQIALTLAVYNVLSWQMMVFLII